MFNFPSPKIDYINKLTFELAGSVQKNEIINDGEKKFDTGSLSLVPPVALVGKVSGVSYQKRNYKGIPLDYTKVSNGYTYTINEENHAKVEKIVKTVVEFDGVSDLFSGKFVREVVYEWVVKTFEEGQAAQTFHDYLLTRFDAAVSHFQVLVPISHLHINTGFRVGNTDIIYYSSDKLAEYDKIFRDKNGTEDSPYSHPDSKMSGMVFCSCVVYAEPVKAQELAYQLQSSAVDVLIITSETIDQPDFELSFDLEHRNRHKLGLNSTFMIKNSDPAMIMPIHAITPPQIMITKEVLDVMQRRNFETFSSFLRNDKAQQTELGRLIKNAIHDFANAITNPDLHSRTAQIFSVIESLLLPGDSSPIIDSIKKYCPRIVTTNTDDRSDIISMLTRMYSVRSQIVHHAKRPKFEIDDLAMLQRVTNFLCAKLIHKIETYPTKKAVLDEIDEKLLKAG